MTLQTIILLITVGLAAGVLSGMVGVGGGIIIVPCLVFFLGFSQKAAQGNSLALLLLPLGILGVMNYQKGGYVDYRVVVAMAAGFVIGNFYGSKWALTINDEKLKKIFAIILLLAAIKILFIDKPKPKTNMETGSTGLPQKLNNP
ncbi:MAG: sulfite exporter TauE/SafE family protein [Bacteroidota bacterium]